MKQETLTKKILLLLPTSKEDAIRKDYIAQKLDITISAAVKEIKRIRLSGIPILWCGKGIYIDYTPNAIHNMNLTINNMRIGYDIGMGNIHKVFTDIIDGKYDKV